MGKGRLPKVEGKGIKQDVIPYLAKLEFGNVLIEEWIIDANLQRLQEE